MRSLNFLGLSELLWIADFSQFVSNKRNYQQAVAITAAAEAPMTLYKARNTEK
jgi:hypothetical protein